MYGGSAYDGCLNCGKDVFCTKDDEFDSNFCSLKCEEEFLRGLQEENRKS
ncbi:hypothetical protein [Methanohalophilus euhalobius]|uniref:Uncharacterized protein n=1 Tax=Methanohalophilus euhalobius TaxID=51203 RepID=A0A314ZVH1_9EURY|nr:hypothetical protein [Methanohalophilus euhalobius]PQV42067.1 hypothetical protein B0H22_1094 [Methanohalophilus euhalobius]